MDEQGEYRGDENGAEKAMTTGAESVKATFCQVGQKNYQVLYHC